MQTFLDPKKCSGCHACFSVCPKNCIEMQPDAEGFLHPVIDNQKCIDCGLCQKTCPVLHDYSPNSRGMAYACINNNENIRMQSSSGGIFTLLAEYTLSPGGVVYGAALDDELNVRHVKIDSIADIHKLRGSKYVQSRIGDTFKSAKEQLDMGKHVLFSGTPCQISGLKAYLKKDYSNLVLLDFVCHGVPSPKIWQKYLNFYKNAEGQLPDQVSFRNKRFGWKLYSMKLDFPNGKACSANLSKDLFLRAFLADLCLRHSCHNCHSKSVERESDITLADFWGVEKLYPEFFDNKGTSLVLVNSENGNKLFDKIKPQMRYAEVDFDKATSLNPAVSRPAKLPQNRSKFMALADTVPFDKAVSQCIKRPLSSKLKTAVKIILHKVIK